MFQIYALLSEESGATAAEYGLILALIAGVIAVTLGTLGNDINAAFTAVSTAI
jgi:pilus assembly protein Flp/PilA